MTEDLEMKQGNTSPEETQTRVSERVKKKGKKAINKKFETLERLSVEYVPVGNLYPNDWNPNRQSDHDFELLIRSMEEDGFTQPIVAVKKPEGGFKIVDGEHRWRAANTLGYEEVPVTVVPMSEEQARIATLRHNRARGSEDVDLTAKLLRDLEKVGAIDWAQDSLMIDDAELEKMLTDIAVPEALAAEDWSEAWEPEDVTQDGADPESVRTREITGTQGQQVVSASTFEAVEKQREMEKKLVEAKTAEERQALKRDNEIFRIYLTFTGQEAEIVKGVLGERAAEKLVELCKEKLDLKVDLPPEGVE
jgi:ParB/RepB/Spo0J family partition protein